MQKVESILNSEHISVLHIDETQPSCCRHVFHSFLFCRKWGEKKGHKKWQWICSFYFVLFYCILIPVYCVRTRAGRNKNNPCVTGGRSHTGSLGGKCFEARARRRSDNGNVSILLLCRSQDTCDSPVTPIHNQPFCCSVFLPLSQRRSGSFSGQPALMLRLVRPQSPAGASVLYKQLIKHLGFGWGGSEEEKHGRWEATMTSCWFFFSLSFSATTKLQMSTNIK